MIFYEMNRNIQYVLNEARGIGNFKYTATTPLKLTPPILEFCQSLSEHEPVFIDVEPTGYFARCYFNVNEQIMAGEGTGWFGWYIWELPGIYLRAEGHAALNTDTDWKDITPTLMGEHRILFLPWQPMPALADIEDVSNDIKNALKRLHIFPLSKSAIVQRICELNHEKHKEEQIQLMTGHLTERCKRLSHLCCFLTDEFRTSGKKREAKHRLRKARKSERQRRR